ncbi:MAG: nucleotidyltransferase family protein [Gammaproteobacteria bacterium]|nr:nucleotidyltransferase family protein [Gammaproteobacteria bacterium]
MTDPGLFAIVLAASESRRFGSTKQLATLAGRALVAYATGAAESVCGPRTILVVGNEWRNVATACGNLQGFLTVNTAYREGLSTSIRAGVACLPDAADAVLLLLADQPLITSEHLQTLVDQWRESPDSIIASTYADTLGPPVIFPRRFFTSLQSLRGDRGAKSVFDANSDYVVAVECTAAAHDVDHPEDLERL